MEFFTVGDYLTEDLASKLGVKKTSHMKRDVKTKLENFGYGVAAKAKNKHTVIQTVPTTIEDRITEIVMRRFGKTKNFNARAFSCFLFKITQDVEFQTMPWSERSRVIDEEFGVQVSDDTLSSWAKMLLEENIIAKHIDPENTQYWRTYYYLNEKIQEPVASDEDKEAMQDYFNKRNEYLKQADIDYQKAMGEADVKNPKRWKLALNKLWSETETCYYPCRRFQENAIKEPEIIMLEELVPFLIMEIEKDYEEQLLREQEERKKKLDEEYAAAITKEEPKSMVERCTDANGNFVF